ncbi:hypothetical protein Hanom_Chr10g00911081 [Helianthus anomalus]
MASSSFSIQILCDYNSATKSITTILVRLQKNSFVRLLLRVRLNYLVRSNILVRFYLVRSDQSSSTVNFSSTPNHLRQFRNTIILPVHYYHHPKQIRNTILILSSLKRRSAFRITSSVHHLRTVHHLRFGIEFEFGFRYRKLSPAATIFQSSPSLPSPTITISSGLHLYCYISNHHLQTTCNLQRDLYQLRTPSQSP